MENLPDLSLSRLERQEQRKTGTDAEAVTSESLSEARFQSGQIETSRKTGGHPIPKNAPRNTSPIWLGGRLSTRAIQALLVPQVTSRQSRKAEIQQGHPRSDPADVSRESNLGDTQDSIRIGIAPL